MDDSVFNRLYEQYHNDVFRFLIYLIRDRDQAEDLMHEVYVRVLRAYSGFEGKSSEKTWLFSIAKNVAIDHYRKNSVRRKHSFDKFDWEKSELVSTETLPDNLIVLNEEMKELLNVLDTCTGDQKMVIHMRYIHDLSIADTAEVLGWSEGKVKTTQHRAINALRKKLSR
jgi:RNA polymerase sigma-70 factor, ECF subfamily